MVFDLPNTAIGHRSATIFIGGPRCNWMTALMLTDGPMDGDVFLAYVREFLVLVLQHGDIVVLGNPSSHKLKGMREVIAAAGAIPLGIAAR